MLAAILATVIGTGAWYGDRGFFAPGWAWQVVSIIDSKGRQGEVRGHGDSDDPLDAWVQDGVFHVRVKSDHRAFDGRGKAVRSQSPSFNDDAIRAPDGFGGTVRVAREKPVAWSHSTGAKGTLPGDNVVTILGRRGVGLLIATRGSEQSYLSFVDRKGLHRLATLKGDWGGAALGADGSVIASSYAELTEPALQHYEGMTSIYRIEGLRASRLRRTKGLLKVVDYRPSTGEMVLLECHNHFGDSLMLMDRRGKLKEYGDGYGLALPVGLDFGMTTGWVGPL